MFNIFQKSNPMFKIYQPKTIATITADLSRMVEELEDHAADLKGQMEFKLMQVQQLSIEAIEHSAIADKAEATAAKIKALFS